MGFVRKLGGGSTPIQSGLGLPKIGDLVSGISGQSGAEAALAGSQLQYLSSKEAREQLERLNRPYLDLGNSAIPAFKSFTADPSGYSFLQNNPMFSAAVDNANSVVSNASAASGKFNSGGTVSELFNRYLSMGDQFVNSAYNRLLGPVTIGQNAANFQGANSANLSTQGANALAAGGIGAANAQAQGASNLVGIAGTIASFFSDERLKTDMEPIGEDKEGNTIYKFNYKDPVTYIGYSAQEIAEKDPGNVLLDRSGYLKVTEKYKPVRVS